MALSTVCSLICFCTIGFGICNGAPKKLAARDLDLFLKWAEDDKQNIWELSGQFEGDIVFNHDVSKNGIIHDESRRWKNNEIPYEFDPDFPDDAKLYVDDVLKEFANVSCVKVRPKNKDDEDYVYVQNEESGCFSSVGREGGKQILNLYGDEKGKKCITKGVIIHEFLHAVGFYHQQSSHDRDDYVNINWDNIEKVHKHNFEKYSEKEVSHFGVPYDYGSVMHYSDYAFSKNGKKTIEAKKPNVTLGQRNGFSPSDVQKLNLMYNCNDV
ncbi:zinc metalloproteinase nas-13-like [Agrilus planipennis]|uniref:Metalloendopeptidase n=1 Tax=Agrilus planipennis TaxID=224129 RepID=A0A1W4WIN8_AGRPL|nr:zinc metalloproteinase nas-13-like [Agrilus planipennis]